MERYRKLDAHAVTIEDLARGVEIRAENGQMVRTHCVTPDGYLRGRYYPPGVEVVAWFQGLVSVPVEVALRDIREKGYEVWECGAEAVGDEREG